MFSGLNRTTAIVLAFLLGALIPQAHVFASLIQWIIMGMLFVVFLGISRARNSLHISQLGLLAVNFVMGFVGFGIGYLVGGRATALAGFFAGISPTAAAAPVIVGLLRRDVAYVTTVFLLTNVVIALSLPALLPWMIEGTNAAPFGRVAQTVGMLIFVPILLALAVRRLHPAARGWPAKLRDVSFVAWMAILFLVMANASHFVRQQADVPLQVIFGIAGVTLVICGLNFALGRWIGRRSHPAEASQALGQKNTSFTLWLALTYANPLVALGPTFYILWHNLWNSWQLHCAYREPPKPR